MVNGTMQSNIPISRSRMPGDLILWLKYDEIERILKKLKESGKYADSLRGEIYEYKKMIESGRKACQARILKIFFKWPNYDYAWAALRSVRRGLAGIVDLEDLKPMLVFISIGNLWRIVLLDAQITL